MIGLRPPEEVLSSEGECQSVIEQGLGEHPATVVEIEAGPLEGDRREVVSSVEGEIVALGEVEVHIAGEPSREARPMHLVTGQHASEILVEEVACEREREELTGGVGAVKRHATLVVLATIIEGPIHHSIRSHSIGGLDAIGTVLVGPTETKHHGL